MPCLTPLNAPNLTMDLVEVQIPWEYLIPEPPDGMMLMAITPAFRATFWNSPYATPYAISLHSATIGHALDPLLTLEVKFLPNYCNIPLLWIGNLLAAVLKALPLATPERMHVAVFAIYPI